MKYLKQFLIIILISFVGELLNHFIDLPIPGSIYGMVILFILLELNIIKVDQVRETSVFLIAVMPVMFIPAGVGLMEKWGLISEIWLPLTIIILVSTLIVMAVTGRIIQLVISIQKKDDEPEDIWEKEDL